MWVFKKKVQKAREDTVLPNKPRPRQADIRTPDESQRGKEY